MDVESGLRDPIYLHVKGPTFQPPSPLWPMARVHTRNPYLTREHTKRHLVLKVGGSGIINNTGEYHCSEKPQNRKISEGTRWI